MKYGCNQCYQLLDSDEPCTHCGSEDVTPVVQCCACGCYVDEEDLDRHGLCGSQGNNCQEDEEIVEEYGDPQVELILNLSRGLLR